MRSIAVAAMAASIAAWTLPLLAAPPSAAFLGSWQVEHVRNDRGATHKLAITDDDQRLVGRPLEIGADRIAFRTVDGDASCGAPSLSQVASTAGELISRTMAGRGAPPVTPLPADYGLPLSSGTSVQAMWLKCASGFVGPGFDQGDTWFVGLPDHRLAMGYYGSTILVLVPVAEGAPPQASFPCAKATAPAEKAICGSADLASFDRSVAASFGDDIRQFAAIGDPQATAKLKTSQQEWLRGRDRCAGNEGCLRKSMAGRLQALGDTASFTGE